MQVEIEKVKNRVRVRLSTKPTVGVVYFLPQDTPVRELEGILTAVSGKSLEVITHAD